ncbi:MAG: transporter [Betaproteobacteria bacterium]|nr:transporter [Betaproteobacteria bacterium]
MKLSIKPLGGIALLPSVASAFQPLATDDTGTQGTGGNQIEAAYNRTVDKAPGTRDVTQGLPLVFTRGITDALDLYAALGYQRIAPSAPAAVERGWGNPAFGAKWRFYDVEASKLSFALKPEVQFPVSKNREARGLGTARASYSVGLLMTQETGFGAVHANAVAEWVNHSDDALNSAERRTLYRLSAAPVWDVAEGWKLALDAGLVTNPDRAARARMGYVELGAIYSHGKDLELALGIVRNIMDGDARTTQATAGLTLRFR